MKKHYSHITIKNTQKQLSCVSSVHCVSYKHIGGPEADLYQDSAQLHQVLLLKLHLSTTRHHLSFVVSETIYSTQNNTRQNIKSVSLNIVQTTMQWLSVSLTKNKFVRYVYFTHQVRTKPL